jgi:hypothetical protein
MPRTYVVDLTHFLSPDGTIGPSQGPARRFADYLCRIVFFATAPLEPDSRPLPVRCRRRPGRRPCIGEIAADIDPENERIVWWCPACGEEGTISHWQGSHWDRSRTVTLH